MEYAVFWRFTLRLVSILFLMSPTAPTQQLMQNSQMA